MVGLLDLPPELLDHVFELAVNATPSLATRTAHSLVLTHRLLAPHAVPLLWRDVTLRDSTHIERLLHTGALRVHARLIRTLSFIPRDVDGSARGGVGRGIGTSETIDGQAATAALLEMKDEWIRRQQRGEHSAGLQSLDVASVSWLSPDVLEGEWLADLRELVVGVNFRLPTSRTRPFVFSFRLESLTLHNKHWESLPSDLLTAILRTGRPAADGGGLKHLDLSGTYDVANLDGVFSRQLSRRPEDDLMAGQVVLGTLTSLRLPPLETADHLSFAFTALAFCTPNLVDEPPSAPPRQKLRYLELPPLAAATSGMYDALWAVISNLLFRSAPPDGWRGAADGLEEIALRGWATQSLVETAKAVLAAAGLDGGSSSNRSRSLKRLRFMRLLVPEELGKLAGPGGKEVLEWADRAGIEVVCGPRVDYPLR